MSATLKTADELKKLARMFQAVIDAVATMERIGSLEQAEQEAIARVEAANREAEAIKATVDSAKAEAERIVEDAHAKAAQVEAETNADVTKALNEARERVDSAKAEADRISEAARVQVEESEHAAAMARNTEYLARAELNDLENRIEAARARIAKMLAE